MKSLILSVLFLSIFILDQTIGQVIGTVTNCPNSFCLVGDFELDANYYPTSTNNKDWTDVITTVRNGTTFNSGPINHCFNTKPGGAAIYCDDIGSDRTFNDGKWTDPTSWKTQTFANYLINGPETKNFPPKDDIVDVLAFPFVDAESNSILMNAFSRFPGSGATYFDFEYNKFVVGTNGYTSGNVLLNSSAANTEAFQLFSIPWRTNGDIVISYSIDQKGFEVDVYILNDPNCNVDVQTLINSRRICQYRTTPDFTAVAGSLASSTVFFVNSGIYANDLYFGLNQNSIQSPPWGNGYDTATTQASQLFAEVGLNIGAILGNLGFSGCFNWLNVKSRASPSLTSNMKDATGTLFFTFCVGINLVKFIDYNSNGIYDAGEDVTGTWQFSVVSSQGTQQYVVNTPTGVALNLSPGSVTVTETQQNGFYSTQANFLNSTFPAPPKFDFSSTPSFTFNNRLVTRTIIFGNNCFTRLSLQVNGNPATQQLRYNITVLSAAATSLVGTSYTGTVTGTNSVSVGSVALVTGDQLRVTLCNPTVATDCISYSVTVSRPAPSCSFLASVTYPTLSLTIFKFDDKNGNGQFNPTIDVPLAGVRFNLQNTGAGSSPSPLTSGSNGLATLFNPNLGTYALNEDISSLTGYTQSYPATGGYLVTVSLADGVQIRYSDNSAVSTTCNGFFACFGNEALTGINIVKFIDLDANGALVIPPDYFSTFTDFTFSVSGTDGFSRTVTTANGNATISNVNLNSVYTVTETQRSGFYNTTPLTQTQTPTNSDGVTFYFGNMCFVNLAFTVTGVPPAQPSLDIVYFVANPKVPANIRNFNANQNYTITLTRSGSTFVGNSGSLTLVAGDVIYYFFRVGTAFGALQTFTVPALVCTTGVINVPVNPPFPPICVNVFKYQDRDNSSSFNNGDSAQSGFQFAVSSGSVSYTASGTTTSDGRVSFCNLPAPFTFTVTETQRVGWVNTFPQTPSRTSPNPSQTFSTALTGATVPQVNFGNVPQGTLQCSVSSAATDFLQSVSFVCVDATGATVPYATVNAQAFGSSQLYPYQFPVVCTVRLN